MLSKSRYTATRPSDASVTLRAYAGSDPRIRCARIPPHESRRCHEDREDRGEGSEFRDSSEIGGPWLSELGALLARVNEADLAADLVERLHDLDRLVDGEFGGRDPGLDRTLGCE